MEFPLTELVRTRGRLGWEVKLEFGLTDTQKKLSRRLLDRCLECGEVLVGGTNLEVLSIQNLKAMRLDEKLSQRSEVNEKRSKETGTFHETEVSGVVAGGGG